MKKLPQAALPFIFAIVFSLGFYAAQLLQSKSSFVPSKSSKIDNFFNVISEEYVDDVSIDSLEVATINHILNSLDPHSSYIPAPDVQESQENIQGSFEGIGVQFTIKNDTIIVVQVIKNGPSYKAKLRAGDRIISVNDSIIAGIGITTNDVVKLLKGPRKTTVNVGIVRKHEEDILHYTIERGKVAIASIEAAYMITDNTAYIKISHFSHTTYQDFLEETKKLRQQGMKNVIIDLRNNGGGTLNTTVQLANEFLEQDDIIVFTQGKSYPRQDFKATGHGSCIDIELCVLIDEFSASASEVFAGAIQDNDRGTIIGRRSFGKGLVNRDFSLKDGSLVRLTTQKFYSPSGRCIQKPYTSGKEDYSQEVWRRYMNEEMNEKDSIHLDSVQQFTTKRGYLVYGGGGIMPDIFVAANEYSIPAIIHTLTNKNIIYDFAFDCVDNNRTQVSDTMNFADLQKFIDSLQLWQNFTKYVQNSDVQIDMEEYKQHKQIILTFLYAAIANNTIGENGYYLYANQLDPTVLKAIEEFSENK